MKSFWLTRLQYRRDMFVVAVGTKVMKGLRPCLGWFEFKHRAATTESMQFIIFKFYQMIFKLYQFAFYRVFLAQDRLIQLVRSQALGFVIE